MNKKANVELVWMFLIVIFLVFIVVLFFLYPIYNVWAMGKSGEAQLKEAESNRKIAIEEAKAIRESADLKAEAEIIRARGIAEANKIIADSLTDEYLKYKFIEGLNDGNTETIYVPTEANIPILEVKNKE
jgi:regulator of protease activity HflC (stomatin/prohibitin superfamily)